MNLISERLRKLNLTQLIEIRLKANLKEMFMVQKSLEKIQWIRPQFLIVNKDLKGHAFDVMDNALRLNRDFFKTKPRYQFY